ncbi:MAG: hypothetical protein AB8G18_06330 [Gammaproteobacteria bacterium]
MKTEIRSPLLLICALAFIAGCSSGSSGPAEVQQLTASELAQIANGIIITAPASGSTVSTVDTTVKASTPSFANVTKASLLVDGVIVSTNENGAPWDLDWPSYYWADNNLHTVVIEVELSTGQTARSTQLSSVRVLTNVANELSLAPEVVNIQIQDQDSLTMPFTAVSNASEYEFEIQSTLNPVSSLLTEPVGNLEDLQVGSRLVRYRASAPFGGVVRTGPWSSSNSITILPPDLPENAESQLEPNNGAFDATLSWDLARADDTYTVTLMQQGNSQEQTFEIVNDNQLVIPGLPAGNHSWQIKRTNEFGHESLVSDSFAIEAGVFAAEFGGTDREDPQQIIKSKTGGAVVLATTYSDDIATPVDASGDDWIFKVDNEGALVWSTVINKPGSYRLSNLIELDDNSIIAFGTDFGSVTAAAAKLDADGNLLWARNYPASIDSRRYIFSSAVQTGATLLLTLEQIATQSCGLNCFDNYTTSIATMDVVTGDLTANRVLPDNDGRTIISAENLQILANGNYILSGLRSPDPDSTDNSSREMYLNELDSDLSIVNSWSQSGPAFFADIVNVRQRADGQLLVSDRVDAMFLSVSLFSEDLQTQTSIAENYVSANPSGLNVDTMQTTDDGGFWALFSETIDSDSPMELYQYDSNLMFLGALTLPDARNTSNNYGFIIQDDGTALVLLGVPSLSMDRQVLVRKIVLRYE